MKQLRTRGWVSMVSALAIAAGALVALPTGAGIGETPAGAGVLQEPNCEVEIPDGVGPLQEPTECAELEVTKVVTGEVAPGTTFDVVVDCEAPENGNGLLGGPVGTQQNDLPPGLSAPFTETLTFGEEGGTQSLFLTFPGGICTVSEEPPAGCELESIEPEVTVVDEPEVFTVTVTNSCEVDPEAAEELELPEATLAEPRFTG